MRHLTLTLTLIGALLAPAGVAHAGDCGDPGIICDSGPPPGDVRIELNCSTIDIYGTTWAYDTYIAVGLHDDCPAAARSSFGRRR